MDGRQKRGVPFSCSVALEQFLKTRDNMCGIRLSLLDVVTITCRTADSYIAESVVHFVNNAA